jgi:hypothetical protein
LQSAIQYREAEAKAIGESKAVVLNESSGDSAIRKSTFNVKVAVFSDSRLCGGVD